MPFVSTLIPVEWEGRVIVNCVLHNAHSDGSAHGSNKRDQVGCRPWRSALVKNFCACWLHIQTCVSDLCSSLKSIVHQFHLSFESLAKVIT